MLLGIFKLFDKTILTLICLICGIFRKKRPISEFNLAYDVQKILFIRLTGRGDILVILPLLKVWKDNFPDKKIAILISPSVKDLIEGHPFIDEIIEFDASGKDLGLFEYFKLIRKLRVKKFDLAIELSQYYRIVSLISFSAKIPFVAGFDIKGQQKEKLHDFRIPYHINMHELENYLGFATFFKLTIPQKPCMISIPYSDNDKRKVDMLLSGLKLSHPLTVLIHPGTSRLNIKNRWETDKWLHLIQRLSRIKKVSIMVSGGPEEIFFKCPDKPDKGIFNLIGKLTLKELAYLCSKSHLYIGLDTGPTHLAAAMKTRVLALFGPNTPVKWGPYGEKNETIYHPSPWAPCIKHYEGTVNATCANCVCMPTITVEEVFKKVVRIIAEIESESTGLKH